MRPLNRPMFKMGGPVKEGIMDGIREPKADGGTIGGGTIAGQNVGKGRTGFFNPFAIGAGLINYGSKAVQAVPKVIQGFRGAQFMSPGTGGGITGFLQRAFAPTQRFRTVTKEIPIQGPPKTKALVPFGTKQVTTGIMGLRQALSDPKRFGAFLKERPFTAASIPTIPNLAIQTVTGPGVSLLKGYRDLVFGDLFKDKPEETAKVKGVGNVDSSRDVNLDDTKDTADQDTGTVDNTFNDDGTKRTTSVERLLKALKERSRTEATGDALIAAGERIRTGGIDSDTVGDIVKTTSEAFDEDEKLRRSLTVAQIENEFKKQQIKEQAIATNKIIQTANLSGGTLTPLEVSRLASEQPISIEGFIKQQEEVKKGAGSTSQGVANAARKFADYVKVTKKLDFPYQGLALDVKEYNALKKKDEFSIETIKSTILKDTGGSSGIYQFGLDLFQYDKKTGSVTPIYSSI